MIYIDLLSSFFQIGLFSIGGGYAAMPLIQEQVVNVHQWMSLSDFTNLITIAEMTPGPIALNCATFVGITVAGFGGAIVATVSVVIPSLIVVSILAWVYQRYEQDNTMQTVLSCLRPAVVALISTAGLSILKLVLFGHNAMSFEGIQWIGLILFSIALFLLIRKHLNPILVMVICGIAYLLYELILV